MPPELAEDCGRVGSVDQSTTHEIERDIRTLLRPAVLVVAAAATSGFVSPLLLSLLASADTAGVSENLRPVGLTGSWSSFPFWKSARRSAQVWLDDMMIETIVSDGFAGVVIVCKREERDWKQEQGRLRFEGARELCRSCVTTSSPYIMQGRRLIGEERARGPIVTCFDHFAGAG